MTFYPDGETNIPHQTPIPGVPEGRPRVSDRAGHPPSPSSTTAGEAARHQHRARAFARTAMINGAVLLAAVLLAYVFPITEDETMATIIVVGAVIFSATHMSVVVLRLQRRNRGQAALDDAQPRDAPAQPYGAVQDAAVIDDFSLTIEDVFTITGRGTVVTGRVASGSVHEGQSVTVVRDGFPLTQLEVSAIEMFRKTTTVASAGDNVGLLLAAVSRDELRRGDVLTA